MAPLKHYLKHFFTPHHTNNHRARALQPKAFFYYIFLLAILQLSFRIISYVNPNILGIATNITIDRLLAQTNEERQKNGLNTLSFDQELSLAAQKKAEDMFARDYWAHNSPNGSTPWDFVKESGYSYIYAGENLAKDFQNSDDVVLAWMKSPSHRDNVLRKEYQDIGFAVVNGILNGEETTLVVQMFGAREAGVVAAKPKQEPKIEPLAQKIEAGELETANQHIISVPKASANYALGVVNEPIFNEILIFRLLSILIMGSLLTVLLVDGFLIMKRKTVRIAGHNLAHFIFLLALISIVVISASGAVL